MEAVVAYKTAVCQGRWHFGSRAIQPATNCMQSFGCAPCQAEYVVAATDAAMLRCLQEAAPGRHAQSSGKWQKMQQVPLNLGAGAVPTRRRWKHTQHLVHLQLLLCIATVMC
jgi:hypothetical protein